MELQKLVDQSYQTFLEQLDQTRIVLLHPNSRYRSMLVARLINTPELNPFYYAMGPDDIKIGAFISAITHDLADQHPTFGRHTHMLPQHIFENPREHLDLVVATFARDLAEMHQDRFLLILDEYDRSDSADDVQRFIQKLAAKLPENCRIVINSRTLPRLPWVSMIAQQQAVWLEDDSMIVNNFYGPSGQDGNLLEVFGMGPGFVLSNGSAIDTWEGHLPRLLFFFALDRPVVTRSEICQAFWPELDPDQAVNVFHVTKRRLHKALNTDVLVHEDGYYQVNPAMHVYYDVMEFATALMAVRNHTDINQKFDAWQRATDLYRGPFLQGHNDGWIQERRADFRAGYLDALLQMAQVCAENGRTEQALGLLERALAEDNHRDDIHYQVMQLYLELGRRGEAAAHYQKLAEDRRKDSRPISDTLKALYNEIVAMA
ncbi:MAG: BTAD domain-containing putative transcriptional regulator [bacterium]|nr:BTAD domain-containing putative transcriptional regulator [bacterium]